MESMKSARYLFAGMVSALIGFGANAASAGCYYVACQQNNAAHPVVNTPPSSQLAGGSESNNYAYRDNSNQSNSEFNSGYNDGYSSGNEAPSEPQAKSVFKHHTQKSSAYARGYRAGLAACSKACKCGRGNGVAKTSKTYGATEYLHKNIRNYRTSYKNSGKNSGKHNSSGHDHYILVTTNDDFANYNSRPAVTYSSNTENYGRSERVIDNSTIRTNQISSGSLVYDRASQYGSQMVGPSINISRLGGRGDRWVSGSGRIVRWGAPISYSMTGGQSCGYGSAYGAGGQIITQRVWVCQHGNAWMPPR